MKKAIAILVLSLIFFVNQTNKSFAMKFGHGELKLSNKVVNAFIKYVKGKNQNSPYLFSVAIDGLEYQFWICSAGVNNCQGDNYKKVNNDCEKNSLYYGVPAKKIRGREKKDRYL